MEFFLFLGERRNGKTPPKKTMGELCLGKNNVKDEEGYRAAFTERGCSASQMAAAKIFDTTSKLPGMARETSDAISANTQVDDRSSQIATTAKYPAVWIRILPRQSTQSWNDIEDPVVRLERKLYGHPSAGLLWERKIEVVQLGKGWENDQHRHVFMCTGSLDYSCLFTCTIKNGRKEAEHGTYEEKFCKEKSTSKIERH